MHARGDGFHQVQPLRGEKIPFLTGKSAKGKPPEKKNEHLLKKRKKAVPERIFFFSGGVP